jgi:hypothetical protein
MSSLYYFFIKKEYPRGNITFKYHLHLKLDMKNLIFNKQAFLRIFIIRACISIAIIISARILPGAWKFVVVIPEFLNGIFIFFICPLIILILIIFYIIYFVKDRGTSTEQDISKVVAFTYFIFLNALFYYVEMRLSGISEGLAGLSGGM